MALKAHLMRSHPLRSLLLMYVLSVLSPPRRRSFFASIHCVKSEAKLGVRLSLSNIVICVLSICKNRLCAVSAKDGRTSKTRGGRCSIDRYAVFLLHSCPWSLEPNRASNDIIMLSTRRSRLQAASLDTPPSIACCVSIYIEKSKLGFPTHISQSQLNSARFLASKDHNVAIDLVL